MNYHNRIIVIYAIQYLLYLIRNQISYNFSKNENAQSLAITLNCFKYYNKN